MVLILVILLFLSPTSLALNSNDDKCSNYENLKSKIVPPFIRPGDLVFFDIKQSIKDILNIPDPFENFSDDYVMMYIGGGRFIESTDYSIFDMFNFLDGVQITPWWFFILYVDLSSITFGKVNASFSQRIKAIIFTLRQLGESYQHGVEGFEPYYSWHSNPDITDSNNPFYEIYYYPDDPYVDYWYCGELVWAAYLHQWINLGSTEPDPEGDGIHFCVTPKDIRISENITMYD